MGRHGRSSNGSRRNAYHASSQTRHLERKVEELTDRFVLPPTGGGRRPDGVSLFDQTVGRAPNKPAAPRHPNADALEGLSANALREHYRAAFGKEPGQMGKARLREAFLRSGAPPLGSVAASRGL